MKKYLHLFILLALFPFVYGQETYETNEGGEVTSGTIPADYEGNINGDVTLPDGEQFSGEGTYVGGELIITVGTIKGLTIENGLYSQSGSLIVREGTVNDVAMINGMKIEPTSFGFQGYSTENPFTTVNNIEIRPTGTKFEYPSSGGTGVIIRTPEGGVSIIDVQSGSFEVTSDGIIEVEPDGTARTLIAEVKHGSHTGHSHGEVTIAPEGSYSELRTDVSGHTFLTDQGMISLGDAYARKYTFTGRDGFDNTFVIGDGLSANGGWDFTLQSEEYSFDGITGITYDGEPFAGTLDLATDQTLSVEGINMHVHGHGSEDYLVDSQDLEVSGEDRFSMSMLGEFSPDVVGTIQHSHPDVDNLHIHQNLVGSTNQEHIAHGDELVLTSATFEHKDHDDHNEGPTIAHGELGHTGMTSETHVGGHGESHGSSTIYALDQETPNMELFIREGIHEEHESSLAEELYEEHEEPNVEFGIRATTDDVGGSFSYSPTTRQIGIGGEFSDVAVTMRTALPTSESEGVGGHGHDDENSYRLDLSYDVGCKGSWCFGINGFYEGELPDADQLAFLNPFAGGHSEEHHEH